MKHYNKQDLLRRYNTRQTTAEEDAVVESWYVQMGQESKPTQINNYAQDKAEIWAGIQARRKPVARPVKLWTKLVAAAAMICAIAGTTYFFINKNNQISQNTYATDIAPGKTGATLTLSNGKRISLSDASKGELAKEAGLTISKTADGQLIYSQSSTGEENKINSLSTAKGETYMITLSDGTKVWLNAASSLTYSAILNENGKRKVNLNGEAYFEVAKDKTHPFIVQTENQEVEVLGTHFNISAYQDDQSIKTTLLEGSVKVSSSTTSKVLKPDQQSTLASGTIVLDNVDAGDAVAWKNGMFVFQDEPLEQVMRKIARWYNVEIDYQGADRSMRIGGGVSRYENVSKVLKQLELTKGVHFKIEGRKIIAEK